MNKKHILNNLDLTITKPKLGDWFQNITLDDILDNLQSDIPVDNDKLYDLYLELYPDLKDYHMVTPSEIKKIKKGKVVRYSRSLDSVSTNCIIINIKYVGQMIDAKIPLTEKTLMDPPDHAIEYFLVRGFGDKPRFWKLYPENYYFFIMKDLTDRVHKNDIGKLLLERFSKEDQEYIKKRLISQ